MSAPSPCTCFLVCHCTAAVPLYTHDSHSLCLKLELPGSLPWPGTVLPIDLAPPRSRRAGWRGFLLIHSFTARPPKHPLAPSCCTLLIHPSISTSLFLLCSALVVPSFPSLSFPLLPLPLQRSPSGSGHHHHHPHHSLTQHANFIEEHFKEGDSGGSCVSISTAHPQPPRHRYPLCTTRGVRAPVGEHRTEEPPRVPVHKTSPAVAEDARQEEPLPQAGQHHLGPPAHQRRRAGRQQ